jgi:hypothetical protein
MPTRPGGDRLAAAVYLVGAGGDRHRSVRADRCDPAVIDDQGLVRARCGTGAVDQGDMLDRDQRPALAHRIRRRPGRLRAARQCTEQAGEHDNKRLLEIGHGAISCGSPQAS